MRSKRYREEDQGRDTCPVRQVQGSTTWEIVHYTNSLPVAKRHVAATVKSPEIQAARVVNQITGQVMAYEQG